MNFFVNHLAYVKLLIRVRVIYVEQRAPSMCDGVIIFVSTCTILSELQAVTLPIGPIMTNLFHSSKSYNQEIRQLYCSKKKNISISDILVEKQ